MSVRKHSGLQREVFSLYRRALRLIPTKPAPVQGKFSLFVRYNFRQNARSISPRDITAIEHLLRKGQRQIEQLEDTAMKDCWVGGEMLDWGLRNPGRRRHMQDHS